MAERVTDPEALAVWEALSFRFDTGQLDRWMNGEVWVLTAGVDYPIKWPWATLKFRLRQNASARKGRLRIGRLSETQTEIQFSKRESQIVVDMMVLEEFARHQREASQSMESEDPGA